MNKKHFKHALHQVIVEFEQFLLMKNDAYGNSAFEPLNKFSQASPLEQIRIRKDDKLKKMIKGQNLELEDAAEDFCGYHFLEKVYQRLAQVRPREVDENEDRAALFKEIRESIEETEGGK